MTSSTASAGEARQCTTKQFGECFLDADEERVYVVIPRRSLWDERDQYRACMQAAHRLSGGRFFSSQLVSCNAGGGPRNGIFLQERAAPPGLRRLRC